MSATGSVTESMDLQIDHLLKHRSVFRLLKDRVKGTVDTFHVTVIKLAGGNKPERCISFSDQVVDVIVSFWCRAR